MKFYIDESGNTGDAATLKWQNQPTFVLAAVGESKSNKSLDSHLKSLRDKHHIQMPELKGSRLFETKAEFIADLVELLIDGEYPIFVEVMDKKYFVTTLLVSSFLSSAEKLMSDVSEARDCNLIAEIIYKNFDSSIIRSYGRACLERTPEAVYKFMYDFVMEVREHHEAASAPHEWKTEADAASWANIVDIGNRGFASTKAFERMRDEGAEDAQLVSPFLPPAERNKRGEIVAMLPHYSAFGNLYARINAQYRDEAFELVHDEQDHFDDILSELKDSMSSNQYAFVSDIHKEAGMPWSEITSLNFGDDQSILFSDSEDEVGIQVADVIAGFCRKYFDHHAQKEGGSLRPATEQTADMLRELSRTKDSNGVNVVSSLENCFNTFVVDPRTST